VAFVLAVALVEAEKAMAFAPKQKYGVDDLDSVEYRCPFAQPGKLFLPDSINPGHQIDDSQWRLLQSQYSELSVDWRSALNQSAAFSLSNLGPSPGTYPNVTVFGGERAQGVQFFGVAVPVEIIRPEIDSLPSKKELRRAPGQEGLKESQIAFDA
jgi:hypothetical protein